MKAQAITARQAEKIITSQGYSFGGAFDGITYYGLKNGEVYEFDSKKERDEWVRLSNSH